MIECFIALLISIVLCGKLFFWLLHLLVWEIIIVSSISYYFGFLTEPIFNFDSFASGIGVVSTVVIFWWWDDVQGLH
jgi:hypothetical protein